MRKPAALALLAISSLLLSACTFGPDAGGKPAAGEQTPAASAGADSGSTPSPAEEPTPTEKPTPSEEPTPGDTETPGETLEPAPVEPPAAVPEPSVEAPVSPEAPVAPVEPLPAGPNDPFVPPPHGEPNPLAGQPADGYQGVFYPEAGYPGPTINVRPGLIRIGGHGYAPNEMISVLLAKPQTDYNLLNPSSDGRPEMVVVYAGADGSYTFDINIHPSLAPGKYGIMTMAPNRGRNSENPDAGEESKRHLRVYVTGGPDR